MLLSYLRLLNFCTHSGNAHRLQFAGTTSRIGKAFSEVRPGVRFQQIRTSICGGFPALWMMFRSSETDLEVKVDCGAHWPATTAYAWPLIAPIYSIIYYMRYMLFPFKCPFKCRGFPLGWFPAGSCTAVLGTWCISLSFGIGAITCPDSPWSKRKLVAWYKQLTYCSLRGPCQIWSQAAKAAKCNLIIHIHTHRCNLIIHIHTHRCNLIIHIHTHTV